MRRLVKNKIITKINNDISMTYMGYALECTLDCIASWSEGSYTFIVASSGNRPPQYVLVNQCSHHAVAYTVNACFLHTL